jgi:hypothetical protein
LMLESALKDLYKLDGRFIVVRNVRNTLKTLSSESNSRAVELTKAISSYPLELIHDTNIIQSGVSASELLMLPLWREGPPKWADETFQKLVQVFPEDQHWDVWFQWYESRLRGSSYTLEQEQVFTGFADGKFQDIWNDGPAAANKWIKDHLTQALDSSVIPAVRPATLEPILVDETVTISTAPLDADLAAADINAALAALKSRFERLLNEVERANIDPRFPAILRDFIERLPPAAPDAATLFDMGHELAALRGYEPTVIEEWPSALSPRYSAALLALDMTLKKFPKWKEFVAEPGPEISLAQAEMTATLSHVVADDLRAPGIVENVDPVVPATLDALAERSKEIGSGISQMREPAQAEVAHDQLESVNNLLKLTASIVLGAKNLSSLATSALKHLATPAETLAEAIKSGAKYGGGKMWEGAKEPLDTFFKESGKKLVSSAIAFLKLLAPVATGWLITEFPTMFSWLKPILQQLGWL